MTHNTTGNYSTYPYGDEFTSYTTTESNYKYEKEKTFTSINWGVMLLFGAILFTAIILNSPWVSLICLFIKGSVTSERVEKEKNF